jgi:hypothetical protein
MNLFGSEDCTCCSVVVHAIGCAVAIDLENHSDRSRKGRLRRLEPEISSWLPARRPSRGFGKLHDIRKISPECSVRQIHRQPRMIAGRIGILEHSEILAAANYTRKQAIRACQFDRMPVPIPLQPQDLVRFPAGDDHLHARHALWDHLAVPAKLEEVRYHFVPFTMIASSTAQTSARTIRMTSLHLPAAMMPSWRIFYEMRCELLSMKYAP